MSESYFVPILIAGTIIFLIFLFFIVFYMFFQKRRAHLHFVEKEKLQYDYNISLMTGRLEEQERAMNQISREIHDNVSQTVDMLQMNIKALRDAVHPHENFRALNNSIILAGKIANDLRNVSYSLNSEYVSAQGLAAVLRKELDYMAGSRDIRCSLEITGVLVSLPPEQELLLFRIAQEALHNSIKHANAGRITVSLTYEPGFFSMELRDNGLGFEATPARSAQGLGFRNMEHRAKILGAVVAIDSAPQKGTVIRVTLAFASPST